jgi:adenylate cyclase
VRAQGIQRLDGRRLSQYRFRHILFQKYVYSSLDEVERAYLHEAVGDTLEALYRGQPQTLLAMAGQLAWHFQEAGIAPKAIQYLHQAGERAVRLCAYQEGIAHLSRAIDLLLTLPASPQRDQQELALQISLGTARIRHGTFRPAEVGAPFARARELCEKIGRESQLCHILGELTVFHFVRAEYRRAHELAAEALSLAQQRRDPLLVALGHWQVAIVSFGLGDYVSARSHFQRLISFYQPQEHHQSLISLRGMDACVNAMSFDACCLWALGYPEQALQRSEEALGLARTLDHAFSLADALAFGACMYNMMRREVYELEANAQELVQLAKEMGMPGWLGHGTYYCGEALVMLGQVQEGIAQLHEGMALSESVETRLFMPGPLHVLAEAQAGSGHPEEGLITLAEAFDLVEETDERHWEAELYRVQADLLRMLDENAAAEASLCKAIDVARRQSARSWELRAATGLARLWQEQGRIDEAQQMLAEIYGWFAEGFDTPDLKEAEALLEELS